MWSSLSALVTVGAPLVVFVVFARHVVQWQLGVVAFAMAWVELVKALAPMGIYEALLSVDDHARAVKPAATLMYASATCGVVIYLVAMSASQLWVHAVGRIYPYVLAMGSRVFFDILAQQPLAAVARKQHFRRLAVRNLIASAVCTVVGLSVCLAIDPLLGVVLYYVLQSAVAWMIIAVIPGALGGLSLRWSDLRELWTTTLLATQVRSLGSLNNFADQLLAAAFISPTTLALYNLGKRVEIAEITGSAAFVSTLFQPLFARRSDAGLAVDYRRALLVTSALCGVPATLFAANAGAVVTTVFGRRWEAAAPIAAALAFSGAARAIGNVHGAYLSVSGQNQALRNRTLVSALLGIGIVSTTGMIGIGAVAWLIALKSVGVTSWSALLTREMAPPTFYLRGVLGVLAITYGTAWATQWLCGATFTAQNAHAAFIVPLLSGAIGLGSAGLFFFRELLVAAKTFARGHRS